MEKATGNYFIIFPKNDFGNAQIFMKKKTKKNYAVS